MMEHDPFEWYLNKASLNSIASGVVVLNIPSNFKIRRNIAFDGPSEIGWAIYEELKLWNLEVALRD